MAFESVNYQCPACGGPLHFASAEQKLVCDYCDSRFEVEEVEALYRERQGKADAKADAAATASKPAVDDAVQELAQNAGYICSSCGAELVSDGTVAVTTCPYCGNSAVAPCQLSGDFSPDLVIPFKLGRDDALAALKDAGFAPSKRIRLLFGTNEETGCGDMSWYVSHGGELPVYGFTPDGEYPIINGEKGILNGTYSRKLHQTGDYRLTKFEGGAASNISPAYAAAELQCPADAAAKISADKVTVTPIAGGIRVEAEGIAVHGSTPEQGENAIGRLAQALNQLPLTGELGDCMAFVAERIGMEVHGESLGLAMRDELSGPLTLNLGVAKFEQETLSLVFSVRYPVTLKYERVYPRLSRGFTLGGFTETELTHAAAIYMPPESELIRRLSKVYEEQTGEKAELKSIGGGTYAKSMPNLVAFGPIFPGDEVREHKPDEYMEIERVLQNAEIIAAAMYELAK